MAVVGPGLTTTALPPSGELALSAASLGVPGRFRPRGDGSLSLNGCVTSLQAPANAHAHTGTLISLATHLRTRAPPFPPHPTPNANATPPHPPHPPHRNPTTPTTSDPNPRPAAYGMRSTLSHRSVLPATLRKRT